MEKEEEKKDDLGFILFSRAFFALGLCQGNMYKGRCQISFTLSAATLLPLFYFSKTLPCLFTKYFIWAL